MPLSFVSDYISLAVLHKGRVEIYASILQVKFAQRTPSCMS